MATGYLRLFRSAASAAEGVRRGLPRDPEDLLELQRGRSLPLSLFHVEGHGRKLRDLLPAHQLHLPHRPQGAVRRVAEPGTEAPLGRLPDSLRLWRRRRRTLPGLHRVCPAGARLGGNAQGEDGFPHGVLRGLGAQGRPGEHVGRRAVFQRPSRHVYHPSSGEEEQPPQRVCAA